jgi:predicted transposase YbfD/YdcC
LPQKVVVAQCQVDRKINEITALKPLLDPLKIKDAVVTADALHAQVNHARYLVEEKQADYLFAVKTNQPTLHDDIASLT